MAAVLLTTSPGAEALALIRERFYLPKTKLYAEFAGGKEPAFNWGVGVMLSALAAAAARDAQYKPWLTEFADATRTYWNPKGPVPGYDVLPGPKPVDRYYDDNAWMALALVETYSVTADAKYLTWARETLAHVLSGEDARLGGGIFWRETIKRSKHACSNAPSAAACLALAKVRPDSRLVEKAAELYRWTMINLQDPSDGLIWDNKALNGRVEKTKWTYNTALMIRSAVDLYQATKNQSYREDAKRMMAASRERWLKEGTIADEGKFAHLLFEAWILAGRAFPEVALKAQELEGILQKVKGHRSAQGFFPSHWSRPATSAKPMLLDQASAARAFWFFGS